MDRERGICPTTEEVSTNQTTEPLGEIITGMPVTDLFSILKIDTIEKTTGEYYVPFTEELLQLAFYQKKSPEEIHIMYQRLVPHWKNLQHADDGARTRRGELKEEIKMYKHSEKVAGIAMELAILYLHDSKTAEITNSKEHNPRVRSIEDIQLTPDEIHWVAKVTLAGLLHDIGKGIELPSGEFKHRDWLLSHNSFNQLTDDQREKIRQHPQDGMTILQGNDNEEQIIDDWIILEAVREHHNTTVEGNITSIFTKIIARADGIQTAITDRPYGNARPVGYLRNDPYLDKQNKQYGEALFLLANVTQDWIETLIARKPTEQNQQTVLV